MLSGFYLQLFSNLETKRYSHVSRGLDSLKKVNMLRVHICALSVHMSSLFKFSFLSYLQTVLVDGNRCY